MMSLPVYLEGQETTTIKSHNKLVRLSKIIIKLYLFILSDCRTGCVPELREVGNILKLSIK